MGKYGGKYRGRQYYPVGILDKTVYAVGGGMEDWAYAASFDPSSSNPCQPPDAPFGPYPTSRTIYETNMLRTLNVLVETADAKTPSANTLGYTYGLFQSGTNNDGHIARNIRLCLIMSDIVQPYLVWQGMHQIETDEPDIGTNLTFGWDIGGAFSVTETHLAAIKVGDNESCPHTLSKSQRSKFVSDPDKQFATVYSLTPGSGMQAPYSTFWSESEMPRSDVILGKNGSPYQKRFSAIVKHNMLPVGNYIFAAIAQVDSTWEHKRPTSSPNIDPVSHIVRARTKPNYSVANADVKILGGTKWFSVPRCYKITPDEMIHKKTEKKPEVNPSSTPTMPGMNVTDVLSKLEEGNWKDKSIALMKTMLADTLILVSTIVVLLLVCVCLCRCMYFRYYYTKHTDEEVENLTGASAKDIELVSQFKDSSSGSTQMAWESIKDETSV